MTTAQWYAIQHPEHKNAKWRIARNPDEPWGNFGEIAYVSCEAHARLIAAAPRLLAALERLIFAAECRDNTTGDAARLIEVRADLAAAAAEARAIIAEAAAQQVVNKSLTAHAAAQAKQGGKQP